MSFVCHSYVLVRHSYAIRMYSYVTHMSLVCHLYATCMYSYVIRISLDFGLTMNQTKIIMTRKLAQGGPYDIGHQCKIFPGSKSKLNVFKLIELL